MIRSTGPRSAYPAELTKTSTFSFSAVLRTELLHKTVETSISSHVLPEPSNSGWAVRAFVEFRVFSKTRWPHSKAARLNARPKLELAPAIKNAVFEKELL